MVKLSRHLILQRALALADAEGLRAVTMRRLGSELGVEAMSLYHHVPNKEALLDGLVELVLEEARVVPPRGDWREHMTAHAHALRAAGHAHPRVMQLFATRVVQSPAWAGAVEDTLAVLLAAGFEPAAAGLPTYLDQLDPAAYPATHTLAGTLEATDPDEEFALGVEVLLAARLGR